jgi:hypothetical protein
MIEQQPSEREQPQEKQKVQSQIIVELAIPQLKRIRSLTAEGLPRRGPVNG